MTPHPTRVTHEVLRIVGAYGIFVWEFFENRLAEKSEQLHRDWDGLELPTAEVHSRDLYVTFPVNIHPAMLDVTRVILVEEMAELTQHEWDDFRQNEVDNNKSLPADYQQFGVAQDVGVARQRAAEFYQRLVFHFENSDFMERKIQKVRERAREDFAKQGHARWIEAKTGTTKREWTITCRNCGDRAHVTVNPNGFEGEWYTLHHENSRRCRAEKKLIRKD